MAHSLHILSCPAFTFCRENSNWCSVCLFPLFENRVWGWKWGLKRGMCALRPWGSLKDLFNCLWNCKLLKLTTPWTFKILHVFNCIIWKTDIVSTLCQGQMHVHSCEISWTTSAGSQNCHIFKLSPPGKYHSCYYKSSFTISCTLGLKTVPIHLH